MVAHYDDAWLYPAALGVLVLSKSHNVLRAAVVPRVLPAAMSLTSANARLSVFGLVTAGLAGGLGAGIAALFGFDWSLRATAAVFVAAGVLAVRLPPHVDVPDRRAARRRPDHRGDPGGQPGAAGRSAPTWCSRSGPRLRCAASAAS